jgi:tetrapyrrole methylase family protein / MazG family protein
MGIVVVGLGPGPYHALTLEAAAALESAGALYLRTRQHPTVAEFPPSLRWTSFDDLYDEATSFDALYDRIVDRLLERAAQTDVTYAVPGHPLVGEASVRRLLERATAAGSPVRVVGGMSFVEAALAAGAAPGVDHLQVADGLDLPPIEPTVPLLVYQVYKPTVASDVKVALLRLYPPDHPVVVVRGAATPGEAVARVPLAELDRGEAFDHLTTLYLPPVAPEVDFGTFTGLNHIVGRLRRECPWDAKQTHASLKRYILEEAYEAAEAIEEEDYSALCDELGDVLLQVALQSKLADERGDFDVVDVLHAIGTKLVRRHPHVFATTEVADAAEVERNWEAIKRRERGEPERPPSALDGLPRHHPALVTAQMLLKRIASLDLTPASRDDAVSEARAMLDALAEATDAPTREAALGDLLLALAHLGRLQDTDAEDALRQANRRLIQRVRTREAEVTPVGES